MSIATPDVGNVFGLTVKKELAGSQDVSWVNTYAVIVNGTGVTYATLIELANNFSEYERLMHCVDVNIVGTRLSTYEADSNPYNGDEFVDVPFGLTGTKIIAGAMLPLSTCLYVNREVQTGYLGKLFYRGALGSGDVVSTSGGTTLTSRLEQQGRLNLALVAGNIPDYYAGGDSPIKMVMVAASGSLRMVRSLVTKAVANVKRNKSWYNRKVQP
jgi:hypothetical protein